MKNMIEVKERRKRISDFIIVSFGMMICIQFYMLFTKWIELNVLTTGNSVEMVVGICRMFGCFIIMVMAGMRFDKLQGDKGSAEY